MKTNESKCFKARSLSGSSYLARFTDTLEEIKEEINDSNTRAVMQGYRPTSWLIVSVSHWSLYDDNGQFVRSEAIEQAVEVYPKK